jgi:hypothetical protein
MFVDRVIGGEKNPFLRAILRSYTAIASLGTHSSALFIAHTFCASVGVGMTPSTSFEAEVRSENKLYDFQLSCQQLFSNFWDGQGTSYPPREDKMYGLGSVSEAKKKV